MSVSWWGLTCLDELRVFVLGCTYVGGLKIFKVCIYIGNVHVRLLKGPTKGPTRRTQGWLRHYLGSVNRQNQTTATWLNNGPLVSSSLWKLILAKSQPNNRPRSNQRKPQTARDGDSSIVACNIALQLFYLRGEWEIHPKSQNHSNWLIYLFWVYLKDKTRQ